MLAFIDDFGGAKPGQSGTEWFGFSSIMIDDNDMGAIFSWYEQEILPKFNIAQNSPLTLSSIRGHNHKYHLISILIQKIG